MAASKFVNTQYTSEQFVESCGAILFDLSGHTKQVCLLHFQPKGKPGEWLLAKGRRNCGEPRGEAALREVQEETGYPCHLYPVKMATRAPAPTDANDAPDVARSRNRITEPFMFTMRQLEGSPANVKLIWWFIAKVDSAEDGLAKGEGQFTSHFMDCEEAVQKLTFQDDRDILQRAINIVEASEP
ncbi:hypothetical protein B0J13DRAFT_174061 [Dactylonectria estremocensis]|uniref:Nudix hydrolase domain-containing protein n=1 Tax=Dactylonectria estremocensis TaxID=1079267 RepID=A0A9P9J9Q5_9HYPO|nr:hypothetical protein B0J13DRAFT_174061 [Dactylonectria estremocensis]